MSGAFVAAGAIIAATLHLQVADRTLPWWLLLVPAIGLLAFGAALQHSGLR